MKIETSCFTEKEKIELEHVHWGITRQKSREASGLAKKHRTDQFLPVDINKGQLENLSTNNPSHMTVPLEMATPSLITTILSSWIPLDDPFHIHNHVPVYLWSSTKSHIVT